jgi:3-deoxy-D-manno-octulosonic acid kinase
MRVKLPEWMAGDFVTRQHGLAAAIVRVDFAEAFDRHHLIEAAGTGPRPALVEDEKELRGGRTGARVIAAGPLGEAVVRPYRRGGLVSRVSSSRYLLGARAFDELILTHQLWKRSAPVPECLAAVQSGLRPGYAACLVTRRIAGAEPAAGILSGLSRGEAAAILREMGRSVRRLHEAGGWHADLNANNLLIPVGRKGVPVIIIDLDRGRLFRKRVPRLQAARNLRRLRRSLRKLELSEALAAWPSFRAGYDAPPDPPEAA